MSDEEEEVWNMDADGGADWIKGWDLPAYKSEVFMSWLARTGETLEDFRRSAPYKYAVRAGWITDDEWTGPTGYEEH